MMHIANLLSPADAEPQEDQPLTTSHRQFHNPPSSLRHLLHDNFSSWDAPSSPASDVSAPSSPFAYSSSTTPSSPETATAEAKASLSFILNDDAEDTACCYDLNPSSFGQLLWTSTTTTSSFVRTSDKRKRDSFESDDDRLASSSAADMTTTQMKKSRRTKSDVAQERSRIPAYASVFSDDQRAFLEAAFAVDSLPTPEVKAKIAEEMGASVKSVQLWFQNQRSKLRKREKKRQAREEARRQSAFTKPKYIFHNLQATAKPNGFLHRFVDVGQKH